MIKENIEFKCLEVDPQKWFDIGNSDALSSARSFFNTEIEVLDAVFIALGYLPTEDDILNFENLGDTHSSMQLRKIRDSFLGNTRLAINLFRNEYFEDGIRSTDKIVELYEQTDYADNDIIVKALRILGAQHRSSETIKNSEATIRLMYLASSE